MFGKILGAVLSAPLRAIEVIADKCEPIDCLGIADIANSAASSVQDSVEYIIDGESR